jgi:hypothetical protein
MRIMNFHDVLQKDKTKVMQPFTMLIQEKKKQKKRVKMTIDQINKH